MASDPKLKKEMTERLKALAIWAVEKEGYKVSPLRGRAKLFKLARDGQECVAALKCTVSSRIGIGMDENEKWRTIPQADFVLVASADGEDGKLDYTIDTGSVWLLPTKEVINRLEILKASKAAKGYDLAEQGWFLSLQEVPPPDSQAPGSGIGKAISPIASNVNLTNLINRSGEHTTEQPKGPDVQPLTIDQAKAAVAAQLGVAIDQVRITVEW
ncbi:hypothetical protein [Ruegeria sp. HKCCE4148]|uniref:hypothetical protein n=1 Tax=Ruegeria sp. HKCCE4148 TaxID=2794829 RepID=UPI001AE51D21|nr:hypothetical protein [Ruegeria sp. HKCCE4148]